jgi:hypothetical protein
VNSGCRCCFGAAAAIGFGWLGWHYYQGRVAHRQLRDVAQSYAGALRAMRVTFDVVPPKESSPAPPSWADVVRDRGIVHAILYGKQDRP